MKSVWFTSDSHFGHKNILEYEKEHRNFSTIEEMNEFLIEKWNSVVKPKDTIYHLGDFCFGRKNIDIAARLNGNKQLILGNHDCYPSIDYLKYFEKLYGVTYWKQCVLSHMPVHHNGLGARWMLNLHGHLHSKTVQIPAIGCDRYGNQVPYMKDDINYFNVSVERHNLTPVHSDLIMERIKELNQ